MVAVPDGWPSPGPVSDPVPVPECSDEELEGVVGDAEAEDAIEGEDA